MEKKQENIDALDELNKGAYMGYYSIGIILDKVKEKELVKELDDEYHKYEEILEEIKDMYPKYGHDSAEETSIVSKAMTWYGIEMKTLMDESTSKIAELLLQGTNMGIIEGRKLLNNKRIDKEIHDLISKFVAMQEKSVENLKQFL